jgi:NAD(P)-dependent dehydrogenase (short-subunit alcohol dehydrogenase family)
MKTVLLIGAGGGIGRACAETLTKNGYRVLGVDRRGACAPDCAAFFDADVTSESGLAAAAAAIRTQTESLDAIVYAAGLYDMDSLIEIDEARMQNIFDVNVFGAYRVNRAFFPLLTRGSRVVLVTSELAPLDPLPFTGLYGITKTTLESYAFSLAMELQLIGISVSVIRPGAVETPLLGGSQKSIEAFTARTSLYPGQAARFLKVTRAVEARSVPPEAVAQRVLRALLAKRPRFLYSLNRNPLLRLLSFLPKRTQLFLIRRFLQGQAA